MKPTRKLSRRSFLGTVAGGSVAGAAAIVMAATGEIGTRVRRIALSWTPGPDGAPPETVTAAPAR